jgi:hypothetical protein
MKLHFKRKKLNVRARHSDTPSVVPMQQGQTINLVMENLAVKQEEPLESLSLTLFNKEAFFTKWRESAAKVYGELETIMADIYGFNDVLSALEHNIKESADPQFEAVDPALDKELNALSQFRVLMAFIRHIFDEQDVDALRTFMLQHEDSTPRKVTDSKAISAMMKELYGLQHKTTGELERVLRGDDKKTAAVKISRGRRNPSTPVNE